MKCPKCAADMEQVQYENIEVDRCTDCKGIWFDMLEHEKLKSLEGSEAIDIGDPEEDKELDLIDRIKCPVCRTRMIRMVDQNQPHIHYEACTVCDGIFLDAGEFKDFKEQTAFDFFRYIFSKERT